MRLAGRSRHSWALRALLVGSMLALGCVSLPSTSSAAPSPTDVDPPSLTELTLSDTRVEPGDTVTLHWEGTDDDSGITQVLANMRWPDGRPARRVEGIYYDDPYNLPDAVAPTSGDIEIPVPADMPTGIAELHMVSVVDWSCNARTYWIHAEPTGMWPAASDGDCSSIQYDFYAAKPADLDVAPLVFGVGMDLPPTKAPAAPSKVSSEMDGNTLALSWPKMQQPEPMNTNFPDWAYYAEWDGQLREVTDDDNGGGSYRMFAGIDVTGMTGKHTLQLWAANRFGLGARSDPLTVNLAEPHPIENLSASGLVGRAVLDWRKPATGQEPAQYGVQYEATYCDHRPWSSAHFTVATTAAKIEPLREGCSLRLHVYARDWEGQDAQPVRVVLRGAILTVRHDTGLVAAEATTVSGRVVDEKSLTPLPNRRVSVQRAPIGSPDDFTATDVHGFTNSDGRFHLKLNPDDGYVYRVVMVRQPGRTAAWSRALPVSVGH